MRPFARGEALSTINDYWERAAFPFALLPKPAMLNIVGTSIDGYWCTRLDRLSPATVSLEMSRVDGTMHPFLGVLSGLTMGSIARLGDKNQKCL